MVCSDPSRHGDGGGLVQEGAGLALLLRAPDGRSRRRLVQEVAHGSLHEHIAPPKLGGAHAPVPNLDIHLRSLAAGGGPSQPAPSAYPPYYSSYYHYYYGYPAGEVLHGPSTTTTSAAAATEHGLRHASSTSATAAPSTTSAYPHAHHHANYPLEAEQTEYDAGSASSSNSSTTVALRRPAEGGAEFPHSPAPHLHDYGGLMGGGCGLTPQDAGPPGEDKSSLGYPLGPNYPPASESYGQLEAAFSGAAASLGDYEAGTGRGLHPFPGHDPLAAPDHDPASDPESDALLHDAP